MSKFELNPTVNESEKSILLKLRISEKNTQSPSDCATHQNTRNDVKHHSFMNIWTPNSEIYQN